MISAASAPWLQPPDTLGAMTRGSSAGAELAGLRQNAERIAQAGRQAADDLAYRYAALQSADNRAQAEQQAQKEHLTAAMELRAKDEAQKMLEWQTEQAQRNRELGLREASANRPEIFATDNPITSVDRNTGKVTTLNPPFVKPAPAERFSVPFYGEGVDPTAASLLGRKPFTVTGTRDQVAPYLGTNAPAAMRGTNAAAQLTSSPIAADAGGFASEQEARAAGKKAGDIIQIKGVGKVQLE